LIRGYQYVLVVAPDPELYAFPKILVFGVALCYIVHAHIQHVHAPLIFTVVSPYVRL